MYRQSGMAACDIEMASVPFSFSDHSSFTKFLFSVIGCRDIDKSLSLGVV